MRTINGRLFLGLLLGSAVLAGGLFVLHRFQRDRIAAALLYQAKKAQEEGNLGRSATYRQRYLDFNRTDYAEMAELAQIWAGDGQTTPLRDRQRAVALLDKVLTHVEDRPLRLLLVKTALSVHDYILARDHLSRLLPPEKLQEATEALRQGKPLTVENAQERGLLESYWGQLLEAEQKPLEALDCYRLAMRNAPGEMLPYVRLAYLLRRRTDSATDQRQKELAEADAAIDALVARNETQVEAYLARWRYRRDFDLLQLRETAQRGSIALEEAAEDIAQALKRNPESVDALLCAADLERLRGRAAAEDPLRSIAQRQAGLKKHRELAFDYLRRGLDVLAKKNDGRSPEENGKFQLLWHKANLLLDDLENQEPQQVASVRSQLEETIEEIRKTRINGASDYLLGRLALVERRWADAASSFELARNLLTAQRELVAQADLFLGQCYGRLQEHAQMYNAYKRVLDWDPSNIAARIGMAEARAAQGQLDDSLRELEVLLRSSQIPARVLIDMARLELQRQINSETPNWNNCQELLRLAEEANPRAVVEIPLMRAEMLMRQGKPDLAKRELVSARDRCPDEVDLWAALVDCAVRRNRFDEARKHLLEAEERLGDKVGIRLARVRMLESQGQLTPALLDQLAQPNPQFSPTELSRLYSGMADACLRANLSRQARQLYARLAELPAYKNDLRLQLLMFDMALRDQDEENMDRILATIQQIEKESGIYHRYGLALKTLSRARKTPLTAERAQLLDQVRADLDYVAKARPNWGAVAVTQAELATLEANPDQAIYYLQQARKNGENGPLVLRRLTALLLQKGHTDEAQKLIQQMNLSLLQAKDMRDMAVSLAIRNGDVRRALEIARASIQEDSRDPNELVYMARILAANKKYDEAEKRLDEAMKLAPSSADVHLARVQFLVETRRKSEVPAVLAAIEKNVPPKHRPLLLAQCYELYGDYRRAMAFYAQAVEQGRDNRDILRVVANAHLNRGRTAAAEPLLRRLLSGEVAGVTAEEHAWAKQQLALVLASNNDYRRFNEALSLLGLKLEVDGQLAEQDHSKQPSEMLRARARVLASQSQKKFRDQAIAMFELLDRRGDLKPEDRFSLAMLYEAEGKSDRSQKNLRELTQTPLRTPRYLAQYALSLLATRRDREALLEVDRLVQQLAELEKLREVGPNGFASVELKARLLEANGREDQARELVRQHVQRPGAKPEEIVLLVNTLSRQKRFDEAFALCEEQWNKASCAPEVLAALTTSLLRVMKPSNAQLTQAENWLVRALDSSKASPMLRMHLADVLDRRGKYVEAAQQWREVLKADPNNFVAMNNLAWQIVTHGGDASEALLHIDKALAGMGRRADLLDTRGLVYLALKQPEKALADFQAAAADGPSPTRLLHLAQAQHQLKDREAAKASLQKAKQVGLELTGLHPTEQETARKLLQEYGL